MFSFNQDKFFNDLFISKTIENILFTDGEDVVEIENQQQQDILISDTTNDTESLKNSILLKQKIQLTNSDILRQKAILDEPEEFDINERDYMIRYVSLVQNKQFNYKINNEVVDDQFNELFMLFFLDIENKLAIVLKRDKYYVFPDLLNFMNRNYRSIYYLLKELFDLGDDLKDIEYNENLLLDIFIESDLFNFETDTILDNNGNAVTYPVQDIHLIIRFYMYLPTKQQFIRLPKKITSFTLLEDFAYTYKKTEGENSDLLLSIKEHNRWKKELLSNTKTNYLL